MIVCSFCNRYVLVPLRLVLLRLLPTQGELRDGFQRLDRALQALRIMCDRRKHSECRWTIGSDLGQQCFIPMLCKMKSGQIKLNQAVGRLLNSFFWFLPP